MESGEDQISMKRFVLLALLGLITPLCMGQAQPQPSAASQSSFEVATIRHAPPGTDPMSGQWSPPGIGRFFAKNVTLVFLIHMAYGVDEKQIEGKPAWMDSELYDVEAKPAEGVKLSREELKPLLQNLLQERFHLVTHMEVKPRKGYALMIAPGGPKLQATKGDHFPGFRVHTAPGWLEGFNWSMPYLATMLQASAGRPVMDKTGLSGGYDLKLVYAPDVNTDSSLPSLFTALQETLGLKLESQDVPVQVVVIDHVDREPTEN
jgi:uncharacterized protein (TIGR03435 family)